jgi:hypothetical protein
MAALNYYLGLKRGQSNNTYNVVAGTASNGTSSDVEVRIQMNNGTNATGITSLDVELLLRTIRDYLNSNGLDAAGADLPPL